MSGGVSVNVEDLPRFHCTQARRTCTHSTPFGPVSAVQVHLYIPEVGSPLYGVSVRAILRDGDDTNQGRLSEVYLDSDGAIGNDRPQRWGECTAVSVRRCTGVRILSERS